MPPAQQPKPPAKTPAKPLHEEDRFLRTMQALSLAHDREFMTRDEIRRALNARHDLALPIEKDAAPAPIELDDDGKPIMAPSIVALPPLPLPPVLDGGLSEVEFPDEPVEESA